MRVLIAVGSLAIRDRLEFALAQIPGVEVIATASHGREALERTRRLRPDILLLDASIRGMSGLATLRLLCREGVPVFIVVLANQREPIYRERFLACGATEVLTTIFEVEDIEQAIARVMERWAALVDHPQSNNGVIACRTN